MAMLGNSEDNTALSRALSQLAEVEDKMEQLHQEQAASDFFILAELLADYIRLLGAVRVSRRTRCKECQQDLSEFKSRLTLNQTQNESNKEKIRCLFEDRL